MQILRIDNVMKSFTLHAQGGTQLPVFDGVDLAVDFGQSLALTGVSGSGKSTLMRMIYGNYHCPSGSIEIYHQDRWIDLARADANTILQVRRWTIGYISQFLRVIPRVPTLDIVAEPLRARGVDVETARQRARDLLSRLNIPEALWSLSPVTFSGGEQQRVNIAHGFAAPFPLLLLDEPTASLDPVNRLIVIEMIKQARQAGTAIIAIMHDATARRAVCDRQFEIEPMRKAG